MGDASRSTDSVGDRLAARSRRLFVGRTAELELVRAALGAPESPFAVLHVHGPGGVGKTRLLDAIADIVADSGRTAVRIDGRNCSDADSMRSLVDIGSDDRRVILLDSYERLRPLDNWVRTQLLPAQPASTVTVIADRAPPSSAWRADDGWGDLLRVVSLRNLDPHDSAACLTAAGVPEALHRHAIETTHGHPLGLALLADVYAQGGDVGSEELSPDVVGILLRRFLGTDPGVQHRHALEVCALARTTTEPVLREALGVDDAHADFEWLRGLSFVDSGPDGIFPHDLARDVIDADLRWRDPDTYRRIFHRVWTRIHRTLQSTSGREQQRAIVDLKFVFRNLPGVLSPVDWESWGEMYPEPATAADHATIVTLIRTAEGPVSADLVRHWLDRQPGGFRVLRRTDGTVQGVVGTLDLAEASEADRDADPGARAAWSFVHATTPPRRGESVTVTRFVVDRDTYQDPGPTLNVVPVLTFQQYLRTPRLAWDLLALSEPDRWNPYFEVAGLPRAEGADFTVGGRCFGLFAHDFRQCPVQEWLTLVSERALARGRAPADSRPPPLSVLSETEFAGAVRAALRDLHRPDVLSRNPLLHTRLVHSGAGSGAGVDTLVALLREAVAALAADPRDDRMYRAVDRTYLHAVTTQEAAAARLGIPFSTYRRHLARGTDRVVAWLWDREVYGPGATTR